jgi:hypothetical protein
MAVTAEQQAAAEKYRKRIAEQDQVREETPTQRGRAFLQGLTFGTADEIEAWLRSANDEEYEQLLNEIRGNLDAYSQARPWEAGIAEIGGAALPALVATVMTGGSALAAVGARLPKLTQLIGKATGKLFGTSGTQTITGGAVVGAGQGAATGFGTGEGGFEERLRGATGGGVIGLGTGAAGQFAGDILAKGVDGFIDWVRRSKGAKASSAAEREIQRLAKERGISADDAYREVMEGGLLVENATLRDAMRAYRAQGGEAAEILRQGLKPRPSVTRRDVTEYLEKTLGGADQNIIKQNTSRLAELKDEANKLYKQDWANDSVPQSLVSELGMIFQSAPRAFDEVQEAIQATPGAEMFFKLDDAGRVVVTGTPTIGQAEMVRRAIANRVSSLYKEGKGAAAEALGDLEGTLRNIIDNISPDTQAARQTWRQMNNEGGAFDVGKSVMKAVPEIDVAQIEWEKALALGDETTKAFRLGVMSSLRRMLGGGSAAGTIKKLLDEDNAQGQLLREIFPEQDLQEMLRRLSIAKEANDAANEILGQSPTAITNALVKQQGGDMDLLDLAIDGATTLGVARMIMRMVKKTDPSLTPDQRSEVVMLLMSQDANRIRQLLQDESGLAVIQQRVNNALNFARQGIVGRGTTQMQAQEGSGLMGQLMQTPQ